jgi:hypothetical protein
MSPNRNIVVALLCAALIVLVVSLPYVPVIRGIVHQHISGFFANPSTPVNESVFASLVSDTPDSVVYPQTYQVLDDPYFMIVGDYENEINVSMEEAVNASMQFLTRYLPTNLTTGLRVAEAQENNYWPGAPQIITDYWPKWGMTLISESIRASVYVNALSGKVTRATLNLDSSDLTMIASHAEGTRLTADQAEEAAKDFLVLHGYTLLPNAMYEGIIFLPAVGNNYYTLVLHESVDGVPVLFGSIIFKIEASTGIVTHFEYRWIDIERIPIESILTSEEAKLASLANLDDPNEGAAISAGLFLGMLGYDPDVSEFELRLIYDVRVITTASYAYSVDAHTGEILRISAVFDSGFAMIYSPYARIGLVFGVAILVSAVGFKIVSRKLRAKPH